jgi:5-formyltetrahydrofolate cyclo-ligase
MTSTPRIPRSDAESPARKADLRKQLLAARRAIDSATRAAWDRAIGEQVVAWWKAAQPAALGVYWPLRDEPDLHAAYAELERLGARCCCRWWCKRMRRWSLPTGASARRW